MSIHEIKKQKLLHEPLSEEAIKLARAIHNTYLKDKELEMHISLPKLYELFKLPNINDSLKEIKAIFLELNEPIMVKDFKFYADVYEMRIMTFCTYEFKEGYVDIELNEEFLEAEKNYMIDKFLTN